MVKTAFFCVNCNGEITNCQRMYSHGRCPLCGYKDLSAGTIVHVAEKGYRLKRQVSWWKFWVKSTREWV